MFDTIVLALFTDVYNLKIYVIEGLYRHTGSYFWQGYEVSIKNQDCRLFLDHLQHRNFSDVDLSDGVSITV